jgi:hypothetical protein
MDVIMLKDNDVQYYRVKISNDLVQQVLAIEKERLRSPGGLITEEPKKGQGDFRPPG